MPPKTINFLPLFEMVGMDWLDSVIASVQEYESPTRFYYWSSLAAISAVVKDRIWINRGGLYKLYPNIYVLLYGPSGIKKAAPIALAKNIVRKIDNTRVINGRSSIEAIIKELGTVQSRPGKKPFNDSCGFIVSSELSSSIVGNPSSMDIMTDLFDRFVNDGEWKYRLKTAESNTLKNPTPVWLAGTNEALFRDFVPEKNVKGGLIGRMFIISETQRNKINSLMFDPLITPNVDKLAEGIAHLANVSGEFTIPEEVKHAFDLWYRTFVVEHEDNIEDDTGFVNRIGDMVLKISMLLSCARRGDLIISIDDVEEATQQCLPLIVPTKKVSQSVKINEISLIQKRALILKDLARRPNFIANRIELLKKFGLYMDHEDLNRVIEFLGQAGAVTTNTHGSTISYRLNMENPKVNQWIEENFSK